MDTKPFQLGGKLHESRGHVLHFYCSQSSLYIAEYKTGAH